LIEVKNGTIKVAGSKVDLMADYSRITNALMKLDAFEKEDIEHAMKVGLMTEKELDKEIENLMAKLANELKGKTEGERKGTGDKTDGEIKKAIDTIVAKFMERM
jgi:hypothetical protein